MLTLVTLPVARAAGVFPGMPHLFHPLLDVTSEATPGSQSTSSTEHLLSAASSKYRCQEEKLCVVPEKRGKVISVNLVFLR